MTRWYRTLLLMGMLAACLWGQKQQPAPEEPPEEDETLTRTHREYTLNPIQAEEELRVGKFYQKKGSFRAAAQRFEEATKWNPSLSEAFLRLGEMQEKLHNREAAWAAFEKYIELEPDSKKAEDLKKKVPKKSAKPGADGDEKS